MEKNDSLCPIHTQYNVECMNCRYKAGIDYYVGQTFIDNTSYHEFGAQLLRSSKTFMLKCSMEQYEIEAAEILCDLAQQSTLLFAAPCNNLRNANFWRNAKFYTTPLQARR